MQHDQGAYKIWPMWARDEPPNPNDPMKNLYGVHPFYMAIDNNNKAHGVFFFNTHAQEVVLAKETKNVMEV